MRVKHLMLNSRYLAFSVVILALLASLVSCTSSKHADMNNVDAVSQVGEPPNFSEIEDITERKKLFFAYMKEGIKYENAVIQAHRTSIVNIQQRWNKDGSLKKADVPYLKDVAKKYKLSFSVAKLNNAWFNTLLKRVDVIPPALALVQSALESAWGTSRFATEGNNFFGQWCYKKGCGIVPAQRVSGKSHEVKKFTSAQQSIHEYFMNVNTNGAYKKLRDIRANLRKAGSDVMSDNNAKSLANGLDKYSELGVEYVDRVQSMVNHNQALWNN